MNVYVPDDIFEILVVVPVPVELAPAGVEETVHIPDGGKPLSAVLPVATVQVGCIIIPIAGGDGLSSTLTDVVAVTAAHAPEANIV